MGVALLTIVATTEADSDLWEEDDKEVLVRTVRGTKERGTKIIELYRFNPRTQGPFCPTISFLHLRNFVTEYFENVLM